MMAPQSDGCGDVGTQPNASETEKKEKHLYLTRKKEGSVLNYSEFSRQRTEGPLGTTVYRSVKGNRGTVVSGWEDTRKGVFLAFICEVRDTVRIFKQDSDII